MNARGPAGSGIEVLDVTDPAQVTAFPWHDYQLVVNAAAYTAVDKAETSEGRAARLVGQRGRAGRPRASGDCSRADAGALLDRLRLRRHGDAPDTEDEHYSPLGVYAQTKAAGDIARGHHSEALHPAYLVGDRRRSQLRPHHAGAGRRREPGARRR